jgi:queuosine precursor transporter
MILASNVIVSGMIACASDNEYEYISNEYEYISVSANFNMKLHKPRIYIAEKTGFDDPDRVPMNAKTRYFLILMTLHSSLLITSTVAGSKLFSLPFGFDASATVFSYLLTFIVLDTIAELYGREYSRLVITLGLLGMAVSATYFQFVVFLPPAPVWLHQEGLEAVVGSSLRIWLGGWIAYVISQNFDVWSFLLLRRTVLGRKSVVLCAWFSLLISQLLDTVLFVSIAFYGTVPILPTIVGQYVVKIMFSTIAVPLVKLSIMWGRKWTDAPSVEIE